jgi:hypothetical protein
MALKRRELAIPTAVTGLGLALLVWAGAASAQTPEVEPTESAERPTTCTYETYEWSTELRRAVNRREVAHPYSEVTADERAPDDPRCTVCREDQVRIDPSPLGIEGVSAVWVCHAHAPAVEAALRAIAESGEFDIVELTGYRVGRTRGRVVDGLRTEWSNHSFGTAIDINAEHNGLYNDCNVGEVTPETISRCRLSVGGRWDPERRPRRSITRGGVVYRAFTEIAGWRWGGELTGSMRDLMHFSLTGE